MKKNIAVLSLISIIFASATFLANNGYMGKNVTCTDNTSASSEIIYTDTGKVKVGVNSISDTTGCNFTKVFLINSDTGEITLRYNMYEQNARIFSVSSGNYKAVFQRGSSVSGKMNINYNISSCQ